MDASGSPQFGAAPKAAVGAAALAAGFAPAPGAQAQTLTTLHSFTGGADGAIMFRGPTRDAAGNLHGMTFHGANLCADSHSFSGFVNAGCGTLWKLDAGNVLTTPTTFAGGANGAYATMSSTPTC